MKENYDALQETYAAIAKDAIVPPNLPIEVAVNEAINLHYVAKEHSASLLVAGVTAERIDALLSAAHATRYAETLWMQAFQKITDSQNAWNILSEEAYELRNEGVHYCRFAFRKDSEKIKEKIE